MKKQFLGFAALLVALTLAYAFTAPKTTTDLSFKIIDKNVPFDPENYQPLDFVPSETTCPSTSKVCAIIVPDTDVYPANHPDYPNLPKVDQTGTGTLREFITNALAGVGDPTTVSGRTLYERN